MIPYDIESGDDLRPGSPVVIDRYTLVTRLNHWITAICLILLILSGLAFFHPSLFFLTKLFGGGQNTRAIHPWIGVVAFIAFFVLFIRFWRSCQFAQGDGRFLLGMPAMMMGGDVEKMPEVGRYNPGQKLYFWGMSILIIILLVTGLGIWDQYFSAYTTIEQKQFAVLIHSAVAVLAIFGVMIHVYMVLWEHGTLRAMTRGTVTGGWAWKHHRKWLRELVNIVGVKPKL